MASSSNTFVVRDFLFAAKTGNLQLLKKLGDGAVALVKNAGGWTALHLASFNGATHVCEYLIEELNLDVNMKDGQGQTPLHHATLGEHFDTAHYLLEKGANPNAKNYGEFTALHYATHKGLGEIIHLLISKGAVVDTKIYCGTPLRYASANQNPVDLMLSPLLVSVYTNSLECLKLLLKVGVDPNAISSEVKPLEAAAFHGHAEIIKCLLEAGANPNVTHISGLTPVEIAARQCNHESVKILFPVTSPIPSIPDWSINGIFKHVMSDESIRQCMNNTKDFLSLSKSLGNDAFKRKDYVNAKFWYCMAIDEDPCNADALSNRSLCYVRLNEGSSALSDAQACIKLRPQWSKAYYREGAAWSLLEKYRRAVDSFRAGLKLEPESKELQTALREAEAQAQLNAM